MQEPSILGYTPSENADPTDKDLGLYVFESIAEDYTADEVFVEPPLIYVDATPVKGVASDQTATATILVPQYSAAVPVQIVPRRGNNQRKTVNLNNWSGVNIWLIAGDSQAPTPVPVTIGAFTYISNAYCLRSGIPVVYTGAAPLWAVHAETDASLLEPLSILFENFTDSDRR